MTINSETKLVGLLGHPVGHSQSPGIHNMGFQALGLNLVYLAFQVDPSRLSDAVSAVKTLRFAGANVTIPHKRDVIFYLDDLTQRAESVGAVNTILRQETAEGSRLVGDNTDVAGVVRALENYRPLFEGKEALVWGSGGAARAVIYALLNEFEVFRIHLVCRSAKQGAVLARAFDPETEKIEVVKWEYAAISIQRSAVLVNATPVGMTPATDASPCSNPELIHEGHVVFDLVYNPLETNLLSQAKSAGAQTIGGIEMLLGQAAESFRAWTGKELPVDQIRTLFTAE